MKNINQTGKIIPMIIFAAALLFLVSCSSAELLSHDLSTLYGVPEFYNVKWDMPVDEVDSLIKAKHETTTGIYDTPVIFSMEPYTIGGIPCEDFMCSFENEKLNLVAFIFSKDTAEFDDITKIFIDLYGEPHHSLDGFVEWEGSDTQIDIWDDEVLNNEDHQIVVRFRKHKGSISLESALPESIQPAEEENSINSIDPLGYLSDPELIGSNINDYTQGMTEGKDYTKKENIIEFEELKDESFITYRFFPELDYMDAEEGRTSLEIITPYDSDIINVFSYTFTWDFEKTGELADSINKRYNLLQSLSGEYVSCTYLSLLLDGRGAMDISFDEMSLNIAAQKQGMYNIQWKYNDRVITLSITIDDRDKSIEGSISFA